MLEGCQIIDYLLIKMGSGLFLIRYSIIVIINDNLFSTVCTESTSRVFTE